MLISVSYENLRLFRDIAQARSFSRGAGLNDLSQSAASQHVQDLEKSMGVMLLDRSRRPLTITAAGRLYLEYCREVLRRKEQFESELEQLRSDVEGTVRVASIYSVGLSEMVELEEEFSRRQPAARRGPGRQGPGLKPPPERRAAPRRTARSMAVPEIP